MGREAPEPIRLLTIQQAADRVGVSYFTIRSWIRADLLPAVTVNQIIRIEPADLEAFLAAHKRRPYVRRAAG